MPAVVKEVVDGAGAVYLGFRCPGCAERHHVGVKGVGMPAWGWNGSTTAPSFTPSILVRGHERLTEAEYDALMRGDPIERRPLVCHSFVTDGRIQFLGDCTHALAGQTVPLPPLSDRAE